MGIRILLNCKSQLRLFGIRMRLLLASNELPQGASEERKWEHALD
jgi:hypothetical protein